MLDFLSASANRVGVTSSELCYSSFCDDRSDSRLTLCKLCAGLRVVLEHLIVADKKRMHPSRLSCLAGNSFEHI